MGWVSLVWIIMGRGEQLKANDWISYKRDANAHANTKQALAEPVIMQEMENVLLSYPCSSPCICILNV